MNKKSVLPVIAVLMATFFWGVVFTFRDFFFFNPLEGVSVLRQIQLIASSLGWVSLSTALPIFLILIALGHQRLVSWIPFLALLWPISVASAQITLFFQDGVWYTGYLTNYPVFLVTEIVLPAVGVWVWSLLRRDQD